MCDHSCKREPKFLGDGGDSDQRGERLVKRFLALAMSSGNSNGRTKMSANLFEGRGWLTPDSTTFLFASDSLQLFVDAHTLGKPRVLVYDDIPNYIVYLGDVAEDAAKMWNFPDLRRWHLVDDDTGEVSEYCVSDPALEAEIAAEVEKTYGKGRSGMSLET